jgi:hypothetical protein
MSTLGIDTSGKEEVVTLTLNQDIFSHLLTLLPHTLETDMMLRGLCRDLEGKTKGMVSKFLTILRHKLPEPDVMVRRRFRDFKQSPLEILLCGKVGLCEAGYLLGNRRNKSWFLMRQKTRRVVRVKVREIFVYSLYFALKLSHSEGELMRIAEEAVNVLSKEEVDLLYTAMSYGGYRGVQKRYKPLMRCFEEVRGASPSIDYLYHDNDPLQRGLWVIADICFFVNYQVMNDDTNPRDPVLFITGESSSVVHIYGDDHNVIVRRITQTMERPPNPTKGRKSLRSLREYKYVPHSKYSWSCDCGESHKGRGDGCGWRKFQTEVIYLEGGNKVMEVEMF